MARFFGELRGNRGDTSRMGSVASGITGHIRGWNVGVRVSGKAEGDEDVFHIYATGGSNGHAPERRIGSVRLIDGEPVFVSGTDERLEELRTELRAERMSYSELAELQGLAEHIDPDDVELREAAGLPEHDDDDDEDGGGITPDGIAKGHRYVMGNVNAYCPQCSEEQGVTVLDCDYDLDK